MRRAILVSAFLLIAFSVLPVLHAQNQPVPAKSESLAADYPANRAGIFIQSSQWLLVSGQTPVKTRTSRGIAASFSYGLVPAKIVSEYDGEHAPVRVEAGQLTLCICHILSLPGDPVLVRLHPKKLSRELDGGRMIVYPVVGGSKMADANKSDLIPVDVSQPDPQVWLVRSQSPLEPGEYALMLGTQNLNIYPFTVVAPPTPASGPR
jgi:hypothetical protein